MRNPCRGEEKSDGLPAFAGRNIPFDKLRAFGNIEPDRAGTKTVHGGDG